MKYIEYKWIYWIKDLEIADNYKYTMPRIHGLSLETTEIGVKSV